jgi:AcrR family transcriptional regulator
LPKRAVPDKPSKRERTRALLIEAASAVIGEKGLDRTSLEDIAARAGMSRGAIYGNFANKEELFLAVVAREWRPILPPVSDAGASLKSRMRAVGEAVAAAAPERASKAVGATSFVIYALTHDEMRKLVGQTNQAIYSAAEARLAASFSDLELPMPAAHLARAIHALTEGFLALYALAPELYPREVIVSAFEALANLPSPDPSA